MSLVGVFAMLLALLVPQTIAFAGEDATEDATTGSEIETKTPEAPGTTGASDAEIEKDDTKPEQGEEPEQGEDEHTDLAKIETETLGEAEAEIEIESLSRTSEALITPATIDMCAKGDVSASWATGTETFTVSARAHLDQPCTVHVESYRVLNMAYNGEFDTGGFGPNAAPQISYTDVDPDAYLLFTVEPGMRGDEVTVALPACGSWQADLYVGNRQTLIGTNGHGNDFVAGGLKFQAPCDVQLNIISECRLHDGEAIDYLWRVDRNDANPDVLDVAWDLRTSASPTGGSSISTGTIASGSSFFTTETRVAGVTIHWGGGVTGIKAGSKGVASENQKDCAYEVAIDKLWVDASGNPVDAPTEGPALIATTHTTAAHVGGMSVQEPTQAHEGGSLKVRGDGSYEVEETLPEGWYVDEDDQRNDGLGVFELAPLSLEAYTTGGKNLTHTVVNRQLPELTVAKTVVGPGPSGASYRICAVPLFDVDAGFEFEASLTDVRPLDCTELGDGDTHSFAGLIPGDYRVFEEPEGPGFTASYSSEGPITADPSGGVVVTVAPTGAPAVTVTNTFPGGSGPESPGPETPDPEAPGPLTPGPETPDPDDTGPESPQVLDALVAPAASIEAACVADTEVLTITYLLDNTASTTQAASFAVDIAGGTTDVSVDAGETMESSFTIVPADGAITVTITAGELRVTETFTASECVSLVLDAGDDLEVETIERTASTTDAANEGDALAYGGAPAIVLILLGLSSISLGGGILRRRRG